MVCLRNICINTLQKGAENDDDDDDDDNNNNNNNHHYEYCKMLTFDLPNFFKEHHS
jgi:hypothetical protein